MTDEQFLCLWAVAVIAWCYSVLLLGSVNDCRRKVLYVAQQPQRETRFYVRSVMQLSRGIGA